MYIAHLLMFYSTVIVFSKHFKSYRTEEPTFSFEATQIGINSTSCPANFNMSDTVVTFLCASTNVSYAITINIFQTHPPSTQLNLPLICSHSLYSLWSCFFCFRRFVRLVVCSKALEASLTCSQVLNQQTKCTMHCNYFGN